MANDGSTLGINAERALASVLGGEPAPEAEERLTREEVRAQLAKLPSLVPGLPYRGQSLTYGEMTQVVTKAILDFWGVHPEYEDVPAENEYAPDAWANFDGDPKNFPKPTRLGLYEVMKQHEYDLGSLGLTGFMWGFAYNQARWLRYEDGQRNPAIIEASS